MRRQTRIATGFIGGSVVSTEAVVSGTTSRNVACRLGPAAPGLEALVTGDEGRPVTVTVDLATLL
jgi:hypothetical protein